MESAAAKAVGVGGGGDDSEDEFKVKDDQDVMTGTKWDSKQRMTVRNLRIREDTAKVPNINPLIHSVMRRENLLIIQSDGYSHVLEG